MLLSSVHNRLRLIPCCTHPHRIFCLFYPVQLRRSSRGEAGRSYLHWRELLCGIISLMDINARSDLWAVGSETVLTKETTRPCSIRIQGTPDSLSNPSRSSGPGPERGRKFGSRIEVMRGNMARHPRLPAPNGCPLSPFWVEQRWSPGFITYLLQTADAGDAKEQG